MSDPEPSIDLTRVGPPSELPSAIPDEKTRSALQQQVKITPTDRIESALKNHIAGLEGDKKRLSERESALMERNGRLQTDLDRLRPELAELRQARRVAGWIGTTTTLSMFLGSCLISHAGTLPDGEAKSWWRALGWSLSGVGAVVTVLILAFGWPPRRGEVVGAS